MSQYTQYIGYASTEIDIEHFFEAIEKGIFSLTHYSAVRECINAHGVFIGNQTKPKLVSWKPILVNGSNAIEFVINGLVGKKPYSNGSYNYEHGEMKCVFPLQLSEYVLCDMDGRVPQNGKFDFS